MLEPRDPNTPTERENAMKYSLFTHGTALQIENMDNVTGFMKVGWGTIITLAPPVIQVVGNNLRVIDDAGPGTWFHLPLTSTTTFESVTPSLDSVTLVFDAKHCRISNVHVYDGFSKIAEFEEDQVTGGFPRAIKPGSLELAKPHQVRHGIWLSFFAGWRSVDVHKDDPDSPFPESVLTFGAAGANFHI